MICVCPRVCVSSYVSFLILSLTTVRLHFPWVDSASITRHNETPGSAAHWMYIRATTCTKGAQSMIRSKPESVRTSEPLPKPCNRANRKPKQGTRSFIEISLLLS